MNLHEKERESELLRIILQNPHICALLNSDPFPNGETWYVAAGGIVQNVWNHLSGRELTDGIKDYDLIYYDAQNLDKATEQAHEDRIQAKLKQIELKIDVTNEARVHLWFADMFEVDLQQYKSCEDAIASWNPCNAVGVTKIAGKYKICAPFGLEDVFNMVVRPNKVLFPRSAYEQKSQQWKSKWDRLVVVPWDEA